MDKEASPERHSHLLKVPQLEVSTITVAATGSTLELNLMSPAAQGKLQRGSPHPSTH